VGEFGFVEVLKGIEKIGGHTEDGRMTETVRSVEIRRCVKVKSDVEIEKVVEDGRTNGGIFLLRKCRNRRALLDEVGLRISLSLHVCIITDKEYLHMGLQLDKLTAINL
jgi:hypothetical protein